MVKIESLLSTAASALQIWRSSHTSIAASVFKIISVYFGILWLCRYIFPHNNNQHLSGWPNWIIISNKSTGNLINQKTEGIQQICSLFPSPWMLHCVFFHTFLRVDVELAFSLAAKLRHWQPHSLQPVLWNMCGRFRRERTFLLVQIRITPEHNSQKNGLDNLKKEVCISVAVLIDITLRSPRVFFLIFLIK